jgi:hypothetical protein
VVVSALVPRQTRHVTFNLTVADFATYFVTEDGVLVHNCGRKAARGASRVADAARKIEDWLGLGAKAIKNDAGDLVMVSRDGARRVRFDVNRPYPHQNPHGHVEELVNGRWVKSGPVFPKNVTPE